MPRPSSVLAQICRMYHDGSKFHMSDDAGTGALILRGNSNVTIGKYHWRNYGLFLKLMAQFLYTTTMQSNFATTATGAAITGAVKPTTYQETYVASSAASTVTLDLATGTSFSLTWIKLLHLHLAILPVLERHLALLCF